MNRSECKKYVKRAFYKLFLQGKIMTPENLAIEMRNEIIKESEVYIAYGKIAMDNLNHSANEVTVKELIAQIDVIPKVYSNTQIMLKANEL